MDTNLILRASTDAHLTADETLTSVLIGPMTAPLWLHVAVDPTGVGNCGATHTLDVELEFCDVLTSTTEVYNMNMPQIVAAGHYAIPFFTLEEYLQVKLNVTDGGGGDLDLGHTLVWIDTSNRYTKPVS